MPNRNPGGLKENQEHPGLGQSTCPGQASNRTVETFFCGDATRGRLVLGYNVSGNPVGPSGPE